MTTLTSDRFNNTIGFHAALQSVRDEALERMGKTGQKVRFSSDCYLLQTLMDGRWVSNTTGLSASADKVRSYKGSGIHRLQIRY